MKTGPSNFRMYTINQTFITPHPTERYRVTVRVPKVWVPGDPDSKLNGDFMQVWVKAAMVHSDPRMVAHSGFMVAARWLQYYQKPMSSFTKVWKSKTAARKQYDAAVRSGLEAKFEVIIEMPIDDLTLSHVPS